MSDLICISNLSKTYESGFVALRHINLDIRDGEILALLGPNGAGKTTLISIICGVVNPTSGSVIVAGNDIIRDYKNTRAMIGMVPQELTTETFETVLGSITFSRGLFGRSPDAAYIEKVLRSLSLCDDRDRLLLTLSRRMTGLPLIAIALSHGPRFLFLDDPTAGVDVELRKEMWELVRSLRDTGVTIILTTHYIEEAEEIADRVAVINHGEIIIVDNKVDLMRKLGRKQLVLDLLDELDFIPEALASYKMELQEGGKQLVYT